MLYLRYHTRLSVGHFKEFCIIVMYISKTFSLHIIFKFLIQAFSGQMKAFVLCKKKAVGSGHRKIERQSY